MRSHVRPVAIATLTVAAMASGPASAQDDVPRTTATAALQTADGTPAGTATFEQLPAGVLVHVELTEMTPGAHGIHIHETGACTPDFSAAGEHFAPEGGEHGFAATATPHAGDLPNIFVGGDGSAAADFLNAHLTLSEGATVLLDADGAALVVHASTDSYGEVDSSGERVACGVIEPTG